MRGKREAQQSDLLGEVLILVYWFLFMNSGGSSIGEISKLSMISLKRRESSAYATGKAESDIICFASSKPTGSSQDIIKEA